MPITRRRFLQFSGLAAATALQMGMAETLLRRVAAQGAEGAAGISPELHLLNRLTWGATEEDVARLSEMGIEAYIDWQLAPESIADPMIDNYLEKYPELLGDARALYEAAYADDSWYMVVVWQRLYRAVYSERQLFEHVVEVWSDHFNVPIPDLLGEKIVYDRDVLRRHALGNFRDLLFATAQSPAMLYYLNNASSNAEHPNENYARELMELHALGVDGGYTEDDVRAVARAFTGWTIDDTTQRFIFDPDMHDGEEKLILGHTLPAGRGIEDGLHVLDILATHPSTARFITRKLIRRFVSDVPPATLLESASAVFVETSGDIRQVLRHILLSSEFMESAGMKFRRPIEFIVAMMRALRPGLTLEGRAGNIVWVLEEMGHLPYNWNPPNGYPEVAGAWMNTNTLLNRWNAALVFPYAVDGWLEDITLDLNRVIPPADNATALVNAVAAQVLGRADRLTQADREALAAFVTDNGQPTDSVNAERRTDKLPTLIGLVLASPQFQWR